MKTIEITEVEFDAFHSFLKRQFLEHSTDKDAYYLGERGGIVATSCIRAKIKRINMHNFAFVWRGVVE